jgi:hypothetical protein
MAGEKSPAPEKGMKMSGSEKLNWNREGSFENLPPKRQAQLNLLHEMNEEAGSLLGIRPYMYATRPEGEDGPEFFHFQGGGRSTGINAALKHLQEVLAEAGGTRYLA